MRWTKLSTAPWWTAALLAFVATLLFIAPRPGFAADLGGSCCSDIEERVAELEATTARKGNRQISLQIYGQVNKALMAWDDGFRRDAYIVDNETSTSRFGFIGQAQIKPGWSAGYRMEFEFGDALSSEVFNGKNGDEGLGSVGGTDVRIRQNYWYIDSERLGRISVGHQSPATDDITIINLGAQMSDAPLHYNNNFGLRLGLAFGLTTDLTWGNFAYTVDTLRGNFARYDSPTLWGFVLSAAAGENDVYDVALRYRADWSMFRFAAGIGYMNSQELDFQDVRGSASLMHTPSGIYLSVAGGVRDDKSGVVTDADDAGFYYAQLGIKRRLLPYGDTTFYGEYGVYSDYSAGRILQADIFGPGNFADWGKIRHSEVDRWGLGVEQAIDASALLLYAQYHHYDGTIIGNPCGTAGDCTTLSGETASLPVQPWDAVVVGARIQF
jgi:predicted porin